MLDVAAAVEALWDVYLAVYLAASQRRAIARGLGLEGHEQQARAVTALWGALHDAGKLSVGFQRGSEVAWARLPAALLNDVGSVGAERIGHPQAGMSCPEFRRVQ
jgi:CRISPR-associated endonuclease/helicase Cas3